MVVTVSLLDPAMDRCRARFKLLGEVFDAAPGIGQRNNLFPEFRRLGVLTLGIRTLSFESQIVSIKPGELQAKASASFVYP